MKSSPMVSLVCLLPRLRSYGRPAGPCCPAKQHQKDRTLQSPGQRQYRAEKAVVLDRGGAAGMAWMIGFLHAVQEAGVSLAEADVTVGASAGATAAALVRRAGEGGLKEVYLKLDRARTAAARGSSGAVARVDRSDRAGRPHRRPPHSMNGYAWDRFDIRASSRRLRHRAGGPGPKRQERPGQAGQLPAGLGLPVLRLRQHGGHRGREGDHRPPHALPLPPGAAGPNCVRLPERTAFGRQVPRVATASVTGDVREPRSGGDDCTAGAPGRPRASPAVPVSCDGVPTPPAARPVRQPWP